MLRDNVPGASQGDSQSPEVLIVSPTRELTLQIYNEARKFVHETIYRPVVVYGGTSVGHQLRMVERGANIVVGTPGRLVDFLNRKKVGKGWGMAAVGPLVHTCCYQVLMLIIIEGSCPPFGGLPAL